MPPARAPNSLEQNRFQKMVVEKIGLKFLHAVYIAKLSETMFSELAVGFGNLRWRAGGGGP